MMQLRSTAHIPRWQAELRGTPYGLPDVKGTTEKEPGLIECFWEASKPLPRREISVISCSCKEM